MLSRILLALAKQYTRRFPGGRGRLWLARHLLPFTHASVDPIDRTQTIHKSSFPIRYTYSARNVVGVWLELFGAWEEANLIAMVEYLKTLPPSERTMLDIGSNYGLYALTAACHIPRLTAYAFECDPVVIRYLEANIELNRDNLRRQGSEVHVVKLAVSDRSGEATFWRSGDDGDGSLLQASNESERTNGFRVECIDGPGIAGLLGLCIVDFAKIDVQGAELPVVSTLRPLLEEGRFRRLQIELTRGYEPTIDILRQADYQLVTGSLSSLEIEPWNDFIFDRARS
jgi:FkbM family methyltransferase